MASEGNKPDIDPNAYGSLMSAFQFVLKKFLQGVDDALPAVIGAYDRATNRARVTPIVDMLTTNGDQQPRATVASVPVMQIGGGGFVLYMPVTQGDTGLLKACDRDVSLAVRSLKNEIPNTERLHSFEDGVMIPFVVNNTGVSEADAGHAVLQSVDGSVKIALWPDRVRITSPLVEIYGGDVKVFGGDVMADGVSLKHHTHGGVETGGGNTGEPNT